MGNDLTLALKIQALVKGVKEIEQLVGGVKDLGRESKAVGQADPFAKLNIRSTQAIRAELHQVRQAFLEIRNSGKASADEIARAFAALKGRTAELNRELGKTPPDPTRKLRQDFKLTGDAVKDLIGQFAGLLTLGAIQQFARGAVQEFARAEAGFRGLEAVANAAGIGIGAAMQEAERLAADGLISVQDAQKGLQNLLARGYSLDQSIQTLTRLKDAAAFNRAAHLSMGEAVVTASEGLKNENSVLVDNAGVTKNVSVLWKEYAEQIGKSVNDLTQQEKIQAEVNGILRETEAQAGNAAKAAGGLQGQMARLDTETRKLKASLGEALAPAMAGLAQAGTALINYLFKPMIFFGQSAGVAVGHLAQNIGAFWNLLKTRDLAAFRAEIQRNRELADQLRAELAGRLASGQLNIQPIGQASAGKRQAQPDTPSRKPAKAKRDTAAEREAKALQDALARQDEAAIEAARIRLDASIDSRRQALDVARKAELIDDQTFLRAKAALDEEAARAELAALQARQAALAGAAGDTKAPASKRAQAEADLTLIEAKIEAIQTRILDINDAAGAELARLGADAAKKAADKLADAEAIVDAIRRETFEIGLSNEARALAADLMALEEAGIDRASDAYRRLRGEIIQANEERAKARELEERNKAAAEASEQSWKNFAQGLQQSIAGALTQADGSFKSFAKSIVDLFRNIVAQAIAKSLTEAILKSLPKGGGEGGGLLASFFKLFGFAEGGWTGPGAKHQPAGVVHADEYVFSKAAVRRLGVGFLDNLHRLTTGAALPVFPRLAYAEGGPVNLPAQAAAQPLNIRIVNAVDEAVVREYMATPAGERTIVNVIRRNSSTLRQILGD